MQRLLKPLQACSKGSYSLEEVLWRLSCSWNLSLCNSGAANPSRNQGDGACLLGDPSVQKNRCSYICSPTAATKAKMVGSGAPCFEGRRLTSVLGQIVTSSHQGVKHFGNLAGKGLPDQKWSARRKGLAEKPTQRQKEISRSITQCRTPQAFATLESVPEDGLFQKLAECLQEKAEEARAQNIAMSVWGFGRLAEHGATLRQEGGTLQVLAMAAKGSINTFAPKELSMMVVGCAKLAWHDQALLNAVATAAIESQNALNPQTLANIAWACRELRYYNAPLMDAIAQRACDVFQELTGQHLAMIMMSLASQDHSKSPAASTLIQHMADHVQEADLTIQSVTNLLWAMNMMQVCTPQIWMIFLARLEQLGPEMIGQKDRAKFYQAYLLAKVDLPSLDLHQVLSSLAIQHKHEHRTADDSLSIDMAISGELICIEDHSARAQYLQQEIAAARARRAQQ
ncbi:hypothetical protein WJX84_012244 [Apatococcus fuscideae]|uniref:FAST kinase leucine-rich domain-containing protein n=1 Tax=Apatococcus fuscideae TaxID=2026836 RepID=A0AAW1TCG7_9CHLO